jgi:membrane-associated phospholipid phosphatase
VSAGSLPHFAGRAGVFALVLLCAIVAFVLLRRHAASIIAWLGERLRPWFPPRALIVSSIALGAAGVFGAIAEEVLDRETSDFDRSLSLAVHGLDSPFMDFTMRLFTTIGSLKIVVVALAITLIGTIRRKDRRATWSLLAVFAASEALNAVLKNLVGRARPTLFEEIATLHTYSFPSGHAMTGAAVYGMIGVVLARAHPKWRKALAVGVPSLVFLIGLSRVFLGVHWPTDVLAGWAAGMTLLLIGLAVLVLPAHAPSPTRKSRKKSHATAR